MKSMTSYGYSEYSCDKYILTMEIKSYNNRYLDVSYTAPSVMSCFEIPLTEEIKKHASRGHIELSLRLKNIGIESDINIDRQSAMSYLNVVSELQNIARQCNVSSSFDISCLLDREGIVTDISEKTGDMYKEGVYSCFKEVMNQFDESKEREGNAMRADLEKMICLIDKSLLVVKENASRLESIIRENLVSRINEMLLDKGYDENRILTEVAVMLMRYTINEETVRLDTHIAEFRKLLYSDDAVGKRIDFLCQEINREINTIGSKSQIVEVNLEVVNMKDCLENIREQARNIE